MKRFRPQAFFGQAWTDTANVLSIFIPQVLTIERNTADLGEWIL